MIFLENVRFSLFHTRGKSPSITYDFGETNIVCGRLAKIAFISLFDFLGSLFFTHSTVLLSVDVSRYIRRAYIMVFKEHLDVA